MSSQDNAAPVRRNFSEIIFEIEAAGLSLYKLACRMDKQYVQVRRWRDGAEPGYHDGERLLAIHAELHVTQRHSIGAGR